MGKSEWLQYIEHGMCQYPQFTNLKWYTQFQMFHSDKRFERIDFFYIPSFWVSASFRIVFMQQLIFNVLSSPFCQKEKKNVSKLCRRSEQETILFTKNECIWCNWPNETDIKVNNNANARLLGVLKGCRDQICCHFIQSFKAII